MYNSFWGIVNNGLHDGKGGDLESQLGMHRKKMTGSAVHNENIYRYFTYGTLSWSQRGWATIVPTGTKRVVNTW